MAGPDCPTCSLVRPCCRGWAVCVTPADRERLGPVDGARVVYSHLGPHLELERTDDGACVFLRASGACGVYERRPAVCRTWGEDWCDRYAPAGPDQVGERLILAAMLKRKLPCEVCGQRDVAIHQSRPADNHPRGWSHEAVTIHENGDECFHLGPRIILGLEGQTMHARILQLDEAAGARTPLRVETDATRARRQLAARYAPAMEGTRCPKCRKLLFDEAALGRHQASCPGAHVPDVGDPAIVLPEGQGVYCWACGRYRLTIWLEPDLCCSTCKAVLLTAGAIAP